MITALQAKSNPVGFDLGMTAREAESYSVGRAILSAMAPKDNSFEKEVSLAIAAKLGRPTRANNAVFVPTALRPRMAGLDSKTNAGGAYTVQTQIPQLIDLLRSQMKLAVLGATFLPGLSYSAQFATETAATGASWVGENPGGDVAATDPAFGAVTASPHALQSITSISRQLLLQAATSVALEAWLRRNLARSHALAFDAGAINGSGASNEPIGILQTPGISTVSVGVNGGVPSYSTICDLDGAVGNANADFPSNGFLSTPNIRKLLHKTFINGTGSPAVWTGDEMLEKTALVSTNCPATLSKGAASGTLSAIICASWQELILAEFGAFEIVADQFTKKTRGMVELCSFSMVDVVIPRPAAFAVCVDAALS